MNILPYESVDLARTFPEWSSPLLSVDHVYIRTFGEVDQVKRKLAEKETEAEFFNTEMKTKWERLKKQQIDFLADVRKYDQFFIENERKLGRISAKITTELAKQRKLEKEIDVYEKRNEYLSGVLQEMENSANVILPYNEFLTSLTANGLIEDAENIDTFINTFVLLTSQRKLHDEFAYTLLETEKLHSRMLEYRTIKQATFLKQTNDLFRTRKQYNSEEENLLLWQDKLNRKKEELQSETEESVLVMKWSFDNVYRLLRKWKKMPSTAVSRLAEDRDQKISFIVNTIDELRYVVKQAHKLGDKSNLSCEADSSFTTVKRII